MQFLPVNTRRRIHPKLLLFFCIMSFLFIQEHDGQWNLPLVLWGWVGFAIGEGATRVISGFFLLNWLFLWTFFFRSRIELDIKLIIPLIVIFGMALFHGYRQIEFYKQFVGHVDQKALLFIIPFIVSLVSTLLFIQSLKRR